MAQAENEILRKRVDKKRIFLDQEAKSRLMKLGKAIGSDLKHIINIVSYSTYLSWLRKEREGHVPNKMGRPRTAESICSLIVKIATETGWGYTRVMGEIKKLGLKRRHAIRSNGYSKRTTSIPVRTVAPTAGRSFSIGMRKHCTSATCSRNGS